MGILLGIFFFLFGTIVGSFLNVVILRYNTGKSLSGRSACASCNIQLRATELIPVLSFIALRGRCRSCQSRVGLQYPLVELFTGAIFFFVFQAFGLTLETAFMLIVSSILIVILVYDLKHEVIPDEFVYPFIALALSSRFVEFSTLTFTVPTLADVAAGIILAFPIWLLWQISSGKWIGLGDAKLFLGVGWLLGLPAGITAFAFSFWSGALVSLMLLAISRSVRKRKLNLPIKGLTMKSEIPFAPFIIANYFLVQFLHLDIIKLLIP